MTMLTAMKETMPLNNFIKTLIEKTGLMEQYQNKEAGKYHHSEGIR